MNRSIAFGGALALAIGTLPATASANVLLRAPAIARPFNPIAPLPSGGRVVVPNPSAILAAKGIRFAGALSAGQHEFSFHVQTTLRNEAGLHAYAISASTPKSLYYRRWLAPSQIADAFGTPLAQYNQTAAYLRSFGLLVKTWPMRTSLSVVGTQSQIQAALNTKLGVYRFHSSRFFLPATQISVPAGIAVHDVSGLTNARYRHVHFMIGGPPEPINGGFANARINGVTPGQLAEAYDLNNAYAAGYTGKGINLGVIGTGPISLSDVPNYKTYFGVAGSSTVTIVPTSPNVVSGDSTPPPVTAPCTSGSSTAPATNCNPEDLEAQLDTEQTSTLARDANILFYLAYNKSSDAQGLDLADDEFDQAIADNKSDVLSYSAGGCELLNDVPGIGALTLTPLGDATGSGPTEMSELAAEGIAVFVSSGDSGSAGCQELEGMTPEASVEYPSSDPNVVAVGGTTTPLGGNGRLIGPITNWGQQTQSGGAAGGGLSTDFQTPSFQKAQTASAAICTTRCVPDVALDADPFTGAAVLYDSTAALGGPSEEPIGGTSQAAPDMAAVWAVILSACEQVTSCQGPATEPVTDPTTGYTAPAIPRYRMGNPNYLLYPLLASSSYHTAFYDIVYGNDAVPPYATTTLIGEGVPLPAYTVIDPGSVSAGPGYDNASGLGFPFAYSLLKTLIPAAN